MKQKIQTIEEFAKGRNLKKFKIGRTIHIYIYTNIYVEYIYIYIHMFNKMIDNKEVLNKKAEQ